MKDGAKHVLCFGGATIDRKYHTPGPLRNDTSNPVRARRDLGGVARNVAENLVRLGIQTDLATLVGDDENGRFILRTLRTAGIGTDHVVTVQSHATAEYIAVLEPDGSLAIGLSDMGIFDAFSLADLDRIWPILAGFDWVFADCNLPAEILRELAGRPHRFRLAVDAVSVTKVQKLPTDLGGIDLLILNADEAGALLAGVECSPQDAVGRLLGRGAAQVILTQGSAGLTFGASGAVATIPAAAAEVVDVTGAGDALSAAVVASLADGRSLSEAAAYGTLAAALTVECPASVRPDLSRALLKSAMQRVPTLFASRDPHD